MHALLPSRVCCSSFACLILVVAVITERGAASALFNGARVCTTVFAFQCGFEPAVDTMFHVTCMSLLQPLPDALRGEQWAFVQLPLSTLQDMLERVEQVRAGHALGCVLSVRLALGTS